MIANTYAWQNGDIVAIRRSMLSSATQDEETRLKGEIVTSPRRSVNQPLGIKMRGPHERSKYDLRRVWECPACHHRERTGGDATSAVCRCQEKVNVTKQIPMRLIEDGIRRIVPWPKAPTAEPLTPEPTAIENRSAESSPAETLAADSSPASDVPETFPLSTESDRNIIDPATKE